MNDDVLYAAIRTRIDQEVWPLKSRRPVSLASPTLYHYTGLEAFLSIVASGSMRASNCMYMNDATEIRYSRKVLEGEIAASLSSDAHQQEISQLACEAFDEVLSVVSPTVFVLSFSYEGDSLSLWNGYGFENSCALGFDWRTLFQILFPKTPAEFLANPRPPFPPQVFPVLYDGELQVETMRAYVRIMSDHYRNAAATPHAAEVLRKGFAHTIMDLLIFAIACKAVAHEYEREYRAAFSLAPHELAGVRYRVRRDVVVPYVEVPIRGVDGLIPLSEVWIGPRNRTDMASAGVQAFLRSQGYSGTTVRRSTLDMRF